MNRVAVIGAGFSGLSTAAYLSAAGLNVHVFEKNSRAGGRARQLKTGSGYVFDMGPSWYWMPDIIESFFNDFSHSAKDYYDLKLLDPSFEIILPGFQKIKVPANFCDLCNLFESIEKGSSIQLREFMQNAKAKYELGMKGMVYKPWGSFTDGLDLTAIKTALRLKVFSPFGKYIRNYFSHPSLLAIMEFPTLFLGGAPDDIPSLYSLMNYAGLQLGTWYPQSGFGQVVSAVKQVAEEQGAIFHFDAPVQEIIVKSSKARGIVVNGEKILFDGIVASGDYHHMENSLLEPPYRNYNEIYWAQKTLAPSCLIFYLGIKRKLDMLEHHTLFFDKDLQQHSKEIYSKPQWPTNPLFYVCCSSRSDNSVAPAGHENLFLLMPLAPGLEDSEIMHDHYFQIMLQRLGKHVGFDLTAHIDFKQSYCLDNFIEDYNAYKGNAYGLANTLMQTAFLKPKIRNKKVRNLFYAGQMTVPGPGVPPALISGKIAAQGLIKHLIKKGHEMVI